MRSARAKHNVLPYFCVRSVVNQTQSVRHASLLLQRVHCNAFVSARYTWWLYDTVEWYQLFRFGRIARKSGHIQSLADLATHELSYFCTLKLKAPYVRPPLLGNTCWIEESTLNNRHTTPH